jgi:hypothetical protein
LLREGDLPLRLVGAKAFIDFLGPQDEPWLRVLLAEVRRFEGRRQRELAERLLEPLPCEAPHFKRRAASRVLLALWRGRRDSVISPREIRARLFTTATERDLPREAVLAETAAHFGSSTAALEDSLFADLASERLVAAPAAPPTPTEVALRTNLAVAQAILMRASIIEIRSMTGSPRRLEPLWNQDLARFRRRHPRRAGSPSRRRHFGAGSPSSKPSPPPVAGRPPPLQPSRSVRW